MGLTVILGLLLLGSTHAKIFDRCELAAQLSALEIPQNQISTWVCIAQHESQMDTAAHNSGTGDHGLFQISELYWCSPPGYACNKPCSAFKDDDISDDVQCIRIIYNEHKVLTGNGFNAWTVYPLYCKGDTSKYIEHCYEDQSNNNYIPSLNYNITSTTKEPFIVDLDDDGYDFPPLPTPPKKNKDSVVRVSANYNQQNDISTQETEYEFPALPYTVNTVPRNEYTSAKNVYSARISSIEPLRTTPKYIETTTRKSFLKSTQNIILNSLPFLQSRFQDEEQIIVPSSTSTRKPLTTTKSTTPSTTTTTFRTTTTQKSFFQSILEALPPFPSLPAPPPLPAVHQILSEAHTRPPRPPRPPQRPLQQLIAQRPEITSRKPPTLPQLTTVRPVVTLKPPTKRPHVGLLTGRPIPTLRPSVAFRPSEADVRPFTRSQSYQESDGRNSNIRANSGDFSVGTQNAVKRPSATFRQISEQEGRSFGRSQSYENSDNSYRNIKANIGNFDREIQKSSKGSSSNFRHSEADGRSFSSSQKYVESGDNNSKIKVNTEDFNIETHTSSKRPTNNFRQSEADDRSLLRLQKYQENDNSNRNIKTNTGDFNIVTQKSSKRPSAAFKQSEPDLRSSSRSQKYEQNDNSASNSNNSPNTSGFNDFDMTRLTQRAPLIMSFPHLLGADPKYMIEGLKPDLEKHETFAILEPTSGIPMKYAKRVQFNQFIKAVEDITRTENVTNHLVPVLWLEESLTLDDKFMDIIKTKILKTLKIVKIVTWVFVALGVLLMILAIVLFILSK